MSNPLFRRVAALALVFLSSCHESPRAQLGEALAARKNLEGRLLSVEIPARAAGPQDIRSRAQLITRIAATLEDGANPKDWALYWLTEGDFKDSVGSSHAAANAYRNAASLFEQVAEKEQTPEHRRAALNDAAVAYLNLGRLQQNPLETLHALGLLDEANALGGWHPTVGSNRASALEKLHLVDLARDEWERLASDPDLGAMASSKLALLENNRQSRDDLLERTLRLQQGRLRDPDEVRRFTHENPFLARTAFEDFLLGHWARETTPSERQALLEILRTIADELRESDRDALPAREVELLASAGQLPSLATKLRQAHQLYSDARILYEDQDNDAALLLFQQAERLFAAVGSPFEGWAKFHRAICVYYSDSHQADEILAELERSVDPRDFSLRGRIQWMRGTIDQVQGNPASALHRFFLARTYLLKSSSEAGSAFTNVLIATALDELGDVPRGWWFRQKALAVLSYGWDHRRIHAMLSEAVADLRRQNLAKLSFPIADQLLRNSSKWRKPMGVADAYRQRARAYVQLGDYPHALEDLASAREAVGQMPDSKLKKSIVDSLDLVDALIQLATNPQASVKKLDEVFDRQTAAGYSYESLQVFLARDRAFEVQHNQKGAEEALFAALAYYAAVGADAKDLESKARVAALSRDVADRLLHLILANPRGREDLILELADQRRSHVAVEIAKKFQNQAKFETLRPRLQATLTGGTTAVMHTSLATQLLITVVTEREFRHETVAISRSELVALIREFQTSVRQNSRSEAKRLGSQLYFYLVEPALLKKNERVIFIPDPVFGMIPMAALYNPKNSNWLIEERELSYYPSLALLAQPNRSKATHGDSSALIVGSPKLDPTKDARFGPLPHARDEATRVAGLYQNPILLSEADATRQRFLQALEKSSVLHFAGHVEISRDSFLRTAFHLAPTTAEEDSRVTLADLIHRDLRKLDLAVLSACETASSAGARREDLGGLAAVFLAGGAKDVLATLNPVADHWSPNFMVDFHRTVLAGTPPVSAFRSLVKAEIDRTGLHDIWWANYIIFGD